MLKLPRIIRVWMEKKKKIDHAGGQEGQTRENNNSGRESSIAKVLE